MRVYYKHTQHIALCIQIHTHTHSGQNIQQHESHTLGDDACVEVNIYHRVYSIATATGAGTTSIV